MVAFTIGPEFKFKRQIAGGWTRFEVTFDIAFFTILTGQFL
jgi:hypothetical protein